MGTEARERAAEITGTDVRTGKRFPADAPAGELKAWAQTYLA